MAESQRGDRPKVNSNSHVSLLQSYFKITLANHFDSAIDSLFFQLLVELVLALFGLEWFSKAVPI